MSGRWRALAILASAVLLASACTLAAPNKTASISPEASTSTAAASPTPSPSPDPLTIASLPFHKGEVGFAYAAITLGASGGTAPYAWSIVAGTFPPGLSLSSNGGVSGSNTTAGAFGFTVSVSDSGGQSATAPGKVTVYNAMAVTQSCAARCSIGTGCARCGGFGTVKGGLAPYNYRISGGGVPRGMGWNGLALTGPFPQGAYNLSVLVTDSAGGSATVSANWSIYGPATLKSGGDCIDIADDPPFCKLRWTYSGGHPTVAPKLVILGYSQYCEPNGVCGTPAGPPPGRSVSVSGGLALISASGSGCTTQYLGTLKLALVDPTACATTSPSNSVGLIVDLNHTC